MLRSLFPQKKYYLDYAASTPVSTSVHNAMRQYWSEDFANPNSIHSSGCKVANVVDQCVQNIKQIAGAEKNSIVLWTSGGTQSNHLAINSVVNKWKYKNPNTKYSIVTSHLEHASVYEYFDHLKDPNLTIHYVDISETGKISETHLTELLKDPSVIMVTSQLQSSEIGTTQDLKKIGSVIKKINTNIHFHIDASQGVFYHNIDMQQWKADSVTLCAQKIEGPKGVGVLLTQRDMNMLKMGTPSVPLIVGMNRALADAQKSVIEQSEKILQLREQLLYEMRNNQRIGFVSNGDENEKSLVLNLTFENEERDSEQLIIAFDNEDLEVSSKSACMGSQAEKSVVLMAMGLRRTNSIRISLHHDLKKKEIKKISKRIAGVLN